MGFQIASGIPVPPRKTGEGNSKYPWHDLKVGDSFFVPLEGHKCLTLARLKNTMINLGKGQSKRLGWKFTARIWVDENTSADGVRVWRIIS